MITFLKKLFGKRKPSPFDGYVSAFSPPPPPPPRKTKDWWASLTWFFCFLCHIYGIGVAYTMYDTVTLDTNIPFSSYIFWNILIVFPYVRMKEFLNDFIQPIDGWNEKDHTVIIKMIRYLLLVAIVCPTIIFFSFIVNYIYITFFV